MLIKENMRLEPPASMLVSRVAKEDTEYEGQRIPKGVSNSEVSDFKKQISFWKQYAKHFRCEGLLIA